MSRRIYVDSRFRHSGTEGDFRVILQTPIELSEGALGHIDGICLSNTFPTVIYGVNDSVYVRQLQTLVGTGPKDTRVRLTPGSYTADTLATELAARLNQITIDPSVSYTVTAATDGTTLTVSMAGPADNSDGTSLKILTSQEVDDPPADWGQENPSHGFPVGDPPTRYSDAGTVLGMQSQTFTMLVNESLETSFVSMIPYRTLFLHSHLGAPLSVGPRGENTIVRRIMVGHTLPGQVILDNLNTEIDTIELPPILAEMHFSVRDIYGRAVNLGRHSISFALVIKEIPRGIK